MPRSRSRPRKIMEPVEYVAARIAHIGRDDLIGSVVRVGDGGGFIIANGDERIADGGKGYVITAAHCLPSLPPPHLARYLHEETYRRPLGSAPSLTVSPPPGPRAASETARPETEICNEQQLGYQPWTTWRGHHGRLQTNSSKQ